MPQKVTIGLIGDYSSEIIAHRAIPLALTAAADVEKCEVTFTWWPTRELLEPSRQLALCNGLWVVPGSPYENMQGALTAIQWARETKLPLLSSCGGFQHLLIEYARNVAGLTDADHAETNPRGRTLIVDRLQCSLANKNGRVRFTPGSQIHAIYERDASDERYNCNFGLNPAYRGVLENAGLHFTAFDDAGEMRAAELAVTEHPFFIGTLFQSERAALEGKSVPLARALVRASLVHRVKI